MKKKNAFFMIEVIISIVIITGVLIVLYKVKDNSMLLTSKIATKKVDNSLVTAFLPYDKKNENKSISLSDVYDLKNKSLEETLGILEATNKVTKDNKIVTSKFSFQVKKTTINHKKYKKTFYSFSSD